MAICVHSVAVVAMNVSAPSAIAMIRGIVDQK